jgi:hypothetical protein
MEEVKYLWLNDREQGTQVIYIYLNEKGDEISGNIVAGSGNPYSPDSIYKNAEIVGIAATYLRTIEPSREKEKFRLKCL